MTIKEILNKGISILKENDIDEANLISKILLSYILSCKKEDLVINYNKNVIEKEEEKFLVRNRKNIKRISIRIYNEQKRIYEYGIFCK